MLEPLDFVATARRLARTGRRKPRISDLRRAVSSDYYALFHTICRNCADTLIGGQGADRSTPAWSQVYRAVEHGQTKAQCSNLTVMSRFPDDIQNFANAFVSAQIERHKADYDPLFRPRRSTVLDAIDTHDQVIRSFRRASLKDRRAFAAWVLFRSR